MTLPSPSQILSAIMRTVPAVLPYLARDTIKAAGYDSIRTVMKGEIFGAVFGYLSVGGSIAPFVDRMAAAVSKAYIDTADIAYTEGGGELPLDEDTAAWARAQLDTQLSFVDALFQTLKDLRKSGEFDAGEVGQARAESWASGLDGFYNETALRGSKNVVLYWQLGETEKHCPTCLSLDGKGHKISWYIEHDYIPRKNGCALDCGGWNCDCSLVDKNGNEVTL